jgi:putative Holliday junction resolvase
MTKMLGLDFGLKRTGLALTDDACIIASPLVTVNSAELHIYLEDLFSKEQISDIVIGMPKGLDGLDTDITSNVRELEEFLRKRYPDKKTHFIDERFTSRLAARSLLHGGAKRSQRRQKANLDKVSAAIILQDFLDYRR